MSTDPLSEAIGRSEPAQPAVPAPGPQEPPPAPAHEPPAPDPATPAYETAAPAYEPPAYEPPATAAAPGSEPWSAPDPERPLLERRPEILVGAALAGGFIAAQLLGRARGR